jgi:hypothetical protein
MEREKGVADLKARIQRLDKLARGLAKEVGLWRGCNDPLLYRERKAYLAGVQDALARAETIRVVLVGVVWRIENQ